jgi:hypothetical protein
MAISRFTLDVSNWVGKAKRNIEAVHVITFGDASTEIVARTPLKTGFLRASWFASVNAPPQGPAGSGNAYASVAAASGQFRLGDTLYLGNTAAYARRLEEGFVGVDSRGRYYNQSGRFWVRGVLANIQNIGNAAAARVAAGGPTFARPGGGGARPDVGFTT